MAKQKCYENLVEDKSISSLMACRLIPLDKNMGVYPFGIGEILRRIIGKVVRHILHSIMQAAAGCLQLCTGHEGRCETDIKWSKEDAKELYMK